MTIQGIGSDLYLINNPIWVQLNVSGETKYVDVRFTDITDPNQQPINSNKFRVYPYNNKVQFDLSEAVKGNFDKPNHNPIAATLNNQDLKGNYKKFTITFQERVDNNITLDTISITKTFIRGGVKSQGMNKNLPSGAVLKESLKIPVWGGYPVVKYFIENKRIYYTRNIPTNETEFIRVPSTCNPLYFRFLNTKGGYSFWLFEKWTESEKTKSLDYVEGKRFNQIIYGENQGDAPTVLPNVHTFDHLGNETSYEITAETRVKEEYYNTISALIKSPEVYIYNYGVPTDAFQSDTQSSNYQTWTRVINNNNSFDRKNVERMQKISLKFDLPLTNNPSVIW